MLDIIVVLGWIFFSSVGISFTIVSICLYNRNDNNLVSYRESEMKKYENKYDLLDVENDDDLKDEEKDYNDLFFDDETPVGKVIMKYDKENNTFDYYSDRYISNRMLETVCRGFISKNKCYDLYVDYIEEFEKRKEVLLRVKEEEKKIVENNKNEEDLFVSFKSYNKKKSEKSVTKQDVMIKNNYNKFKFKGKICDYNETLLNNEKTYSNISFEDFKKLN